MRKDKDKLRLRYANDRDYREARKRLSQAHYKRNQIELNVRQRMRRIVKYYVTNDINTRK